MFTDTDYDKLRQLMDQNPENEALIQKLLDSHKEAISTISHEIRNPLTLVYSTLQLIESQHPEVGDFRYWEALCEDVEYMKLLLEELSEYNNGAALSVSVFDFRRFMEHLVLSFASSCMDCNVEFTSRVESDLPCILGDRIKLREVFLNLLRNASEAVGPEGTIRLEAYRQNQCIIVVVEDSGCGIPKEYLPDIFTPFVTHKQGGTGLGLSIVKRTIDAHQGNIQVWSEPGVGTKFTLRLPIQ